MKITERIFDATTGETVDIERDATKEELAFLKKQDDERKQRIEEAEQAIAAKKVLLDKLGITEEEAKLLLS